MVVFSAIGRLSRCFPKLQSHRWIHFCGLRIISLPPGVFTSDVSWCLRVIRSKIKDTASFAIILNYLWPYGSQIVPIDGRKQFQCLNSLLRRACRWVIVSQLKKKQSKNRERAAEALFFFLPSLPTTHRVFWGGERCRNIVLNNKTRPLVFGIQSMF